MKAWANAPMYKATDKTFADIMSHTRRNEYDRFTAIVPIIVFTLLTNNVRDLLNT